MISLVMTLIILIIRVPFQFGFDGREIPFLRQKDKGHLQRSSHDDPTKVYIPKNPPSSLATEMRRRFCPETRKKV
jgi:hypothetical protein